MKKYYIALFIFFLPLSVVAQSQRSLNLYNWSNYIDPELIKDFQKKYNVKVHYDVYDSNYVLEAKLLLSSGDYDVVFPSSSPFLLRQSKLGIYEKLDKSKLSNYKYLDENILNILRKQDNVIDYAVPYLWSTTGVGYNKRLVNKINKNIEFDSLSPILDKDIIKSLASCGVEIIDSPTEIIPMILAYYNLDPLSQSFEDLAFVEKKLKEIRPYIKSINSSSYVDNIVSGESCVVIGYSGDISNAIIKAKDIGGDIDIIFYRPKDLYELSIDSMAILLQSKNKDIAYDFINFILEPKNSATISNYTGYPNSNIESKKYIKSTILNNSSIYFDFNLENNYYIPSLVSSDYEKARTRMWLKFISNK